MRYEKVFRNITQMTSAIFRAAFITKIVSKYLKKNNFVIVEFFYRTWGRERGKRGQFVIPPTWRLCCCSYSYLDIDIGSSSILSRKYFLGSDCCDADPVWATNLGSFFQLSMYHFEASWLLEVVTETTFYSSFESFQGFKTQYFVSNHKLII